MKRAGVVAALAFLAFARTLAFDFTYDDHTQLLANRFLDRPANLAHVLPGAGGPGFPDRGRPVLVATHFLDRAVGGRNPFAYHLQSVLWHVAAALLVLALAGALGARPSTAFAAAALFAVHPVHVEAVANASNREDVLATVFTLATLLFAFRALHTGRWHAFVLAAASFALALGSKESAIVAPALGALALSLVPALRPPVAARRRIAALAVALAFVAGGWVLFQGSLGFPGLAPFSGGGPLERAQAPRPLVGVLAGAASPSPDSPRRVHGAVRTRDALSVVPFYALHLVLPWPQSAEYDVAPFQRPWALALGALALAALAALVARAWRRHAPLALGLAWFGVAILPVAVVPWLLNPIALRYLYLPSVGACFALAWVALEARPEGCLPKIALVVVGAVFAVATVARAEVWSNDILLFEDAVRHAPRSARAHHDLGTAYLAAGRLGQADAELARATAIDPSWLAAHLGRARIALRRGDLAAAERHARAAVAVRPIVGEKRLSIAAARLLADVLVRRGANGEATAVLERAQSHGSLDVASRAVLVGALARSGRVDDAVREGRALVWVASEDADAWDALAVALRAHGDLLEGGRAAARATAIRRRSSQRRATR